MMLKYKAQVYIILKRKKNAEYYLVQAKLYLR